MRGRGPRLFVSIPKPLIGRCWGQFDGKLYRNLYTNAERKDCTGPDHLKGTGAIRKVPFTEPRQKKGSGWDQPQPRVDTRHARPNAVTTTAGTTRWGL